MQYKYAITIVFAILVGLTIGGFGGHQLAVSRFSTSVDQQIAVSTGIKAKTPQVTEAPTQANPYDRITIQYVPFKDGCDVGEFISWFCCRTAELDPELGGLNIAIGHPLVHDSNLTKIRLQFEGRNMTARQVLDAFSQQTGIEYTITPCAVFHQVKQSKSPTE